MDATDFEWQIALVQSRHERFKLSLEQAEKVYWFEHEREKEGRSKDSFSIWEESDYLLDTFQSILDENQFKKYRKWLAGCVKEQEKFIVDGDKEYLKRIRYLKKMITFYNDQCLPGFYQDKQLVFTVKYSEHRSKIDYLRAEFIKERDSWHAKAIMMHYRHNKRLSPNLLKTILLQQEADRIFPGFHSFKDHLDKPTKAIVEFLIKAFDDIPERCAALFEAQRKLMVEFSEKNSEKAPKNEAMYTVTITRTDQEIKELQIMAVLLLDPEKFIYKITSEG